MEDEIDWERVDQFHAAALQIGRNCFLLKQVCVGLLVGILTLIWRLAGELDESFFVAGFAIPLGFWFMDATSFFYQEKLRLLINGVFDEIRRRSGETNLVGPSGDVIETERAGPGRRLRAVFNHSMWLYPLLMIASIALLAVHQLGWIA